MIIDYIENCKKYSFFHKRFNKAFDYILNTDFEKLPCGRYEIDGNNLYANVEEYETKTISNPEYHKKYIDIQLLAYGEEFIGYCPKSELIINEGYNEEKDLGSGEGIVDFINLKKGQFMIFTPDDAHQPCMMSKNKQKVKKVVVKVRIDE